MKKVIYLLIAMLCISLLSFSATAAGSETALDTGDRDILFSNGYRGFCLDVKLKGAYAGDAFTPAEDTTAATNNNVASDISQMLKVLFTQCFEDIFVSDGNAGYAIGDTNTIQAVVWHFSDGQYVWGKQLQLVNAVEAYTGPEIPDNGYKLTLDNGNVITFYFTVMQPQNADQQDFFAYKIEVGKETAHSHVYGWEWESDENSHWHACECGEKTAEAPHSATPANCVNPSFCNVCMKKVAGTDANNHTGNTIVKDQVEAEEYKEGYTGDTYCKDCDALLKKGETVSATHSHVYGREWESDENNHWHACECGEKADSQKHTYAERKCIVCGEVDSDYAELPPQTSDSSNISLWIMLLLLSMVGCAAMLALLSRKSETA